MKRPDEEDLIDVVFDVDDEFSELLKRNMLYRVMTLNNLTELFDNAGSAIVSIKDMAHAIGAKELTTENNCATFSKPYAVRVQWKGERAKIVFRYPKYKGESETVDYLLFETNDGAREFLDSLIKTADRDKLITVAYLHAVIGKESTLNDYSYGWERKDLNYVLIHSHNRMYGLEMPKPRPIKDIIKETTGEDWYAYF